MVSIDPLLVYFGIHRHSLQFANGRNSWPSA
jgi:hypothetical protein